MKKIILVFLFAFLMHHVFPQSNVNEGINIRFENKKEKGYFNKTQIGLLMGNREINEQGFYYPMWLSASSSYIAPPYYYNTRTALQVSPSVTMTNGYVFDEHWAAGIGVGFELFDHYLFPVFADIQYTLWDNKISPFFALKTGYAFSSFKKKHYDNLNLNFDPYNVYNADVMNYGGFMLHPEMGVKVPLSKNTDLLFTVAYRYQNTKTKVTQEYDYGPYFNEWEHKASLNRLSFGLAIMFR
jgi:hypothetical protein